MEYHSVLKRNSWDQQSSGTSDKTMLPHASQRIDLKDRFKLEKPNLSYADLHHEITKDVKHISTNSSVNHQKHRIARKGNDEDELVKYMSNLPSYLERGKNPQEKVLNVGVLDWERLEKWQCSHKQMPHRSGRSSLSSSNLSSSFSTDASSSSSSGGYICSPDRQKLRRPSLQFHLMSSPVEGTSQVVKSVGESVEKFHDLKDSRGNTLNGQGKFIRTNKPFGKHQHGINPQSEECNSKYSDTKIDRESGTFLNRVKYGVASSREMKLKTHDGQFMKRAEKLQEGIPDIADQDAPDKDKTVVLLWPRDLSHNNLSDSTTISGQRPAEANRRSFSERSKDADLASDLPHSRPLPSETDCSKHLEMKRTGSVDAKIDNVSSERSHSVPRSAKIGACPSKGRNLEDRKSSVTMNKPTANELLGSDLKVSKVAPENVRSTSPFRRLSISMGKIGKGSISKEASALPQLSSTCVSAKYGPENTVASSDPDKPNATSRARSSPLRRLLDPILKPKPANCRNIAEPLPKNSISKDRASKSSEGRPYSSNVAAQSGKVKLDMTACKKINVNDSFQEKKHGSSAVQALLRVAVKNGQPLFTFAVDNENNILAATVKQLSTSRKEDYSCIYTFFTIQEVKKKSGRWLNQGGKGQSHDYIPNVVAQMKVYGSQFPDLTRDNYLDQFSLREFVLFSVEPRQSDQQISDFQPNDEIAAVVVKIPTSIAKSSLVDGYTSNVYKEVPEVRLKDYMPEGTFDSNSGKKVQNQPFVGGQDISATVILSSGVHALPCKGEPSSLIQRWRSGGSCDCGGWDLGCKLRVLANRNQFNKKAGSSKACSAAVQFELFSQGAQENRPFFSLAPFKDGIYSVEFNSSLSLLQAFSVCIAVLDSKTPCEFSEPSNLFEEKTFGESIIQSDGTKAPDPTGGVVPTSYVSYPPLSPVGRV